MTAVQRQPEYTGEATHCIPAGAAGLANASYDSDRTSETRRMNTATPAMRNLARRLLVLEAARAPAGDVVGPAVRSCEKLRVPLVKLAGAAGFRSLLARALALAKAETAGLQAVAVRPDGVLDGFESAMRAQGATDGEAGVVIVAQLLGLLVTFIGEPLTRQLVYEAWPDAAADEMTGRAGGPS